MRSRSKASPDQGLQRLSTYVHKSQSFRTETNEDFKGFRAEAKGVFKSLCAKSKYDIKMYYVDLSTRIDKQEVAVNQMRTELKEEIQELRKWSQQGYAEVKADIRQLWPTVKTWGLTYVKCPTLKSRFGTGFSAGACMAVLKVK